MAKTTKANPHSGSSFDGFLKEDGIHEEVQARVLKRALAEQLDDEVQSGKSIKNIHEPSELDASRMSPARASVVEIFRGQGVGGATAQLLVDRRKDLTRE